MAIKEILKPALCTSRNLRSDMLCNMIK